MLEPIRLLDVAACHALNRRWRRGSSRKTDCKCPRRLGAAETRGAFVIRASAEANDTGTSSQNLSISTKLEVIPGEDKQIFAKEAFFSYGIELSVKPRISPDGLISVEIVPTISEKTDEKTIASAGEAIYTSDPIISVKRLTTEFTMKDGSTCGPSTSGSTNTPAPSASGPSGEPRAWP